jgi:serine/threonine protein kinase
MASRKYAASVVSASLEIQLESMGAILEPNRSRRILNLKPGARIGGQGTLKIITLAYNIKATPTNESHPLADHGDVRKHLDLYTDFNMAWTLRTLHQVTVAMSQLHTHGIAHQDLKPSNILLFETFGVKIGDLGCADTANRPSESPRGCWPIAGDIGYAPPELHYREVSHDWKIRRVGCDLYLLGNLFVFFFTKIPTFTALWVHHLDNSHKPGSWASDYRTVLPYVRDAFEKALEDFSAELPEVVRAPITRIVRCLCEPDPQLRGHPKDRNGNQFALHRFISDLDVIAKKAEFKLI